MMGTTPFFCIVGRSNSGKTTVIELLIKSLIRKGLRVGAIKHTSKDSEFDQQGKDSYRLKHAGASVVAFSSPKRLAVFKELDSELFVEEIVGKYLKDVDIVIVEGYKGSSSPKIEVIGKQTQETPLFKGDNKIIAVISDRDLEVTIPVFRFHEIENITDFIMESFLLRNQKKLLNHREHRDVKHEFKE
ncbi:MAG: molybdopterin-guanine dinucleotide biosynthesis protein B [Nitrospira sp.]|nr:molybdopterin-guanine dinucleotide biosynthesis protein B [Nitrospira sp.]